MARRELGLAAPLAVVGVLGALPRGGDVLVLCTWLALVAPACGWVVAGLGVRFAPVALAVPGTWMVALAWVAAGDAGAPPTPLWAGLAAAGLFALGWAGGRLASGGASLGGAGLVLLASALLVGLPGGGGVLARPWPPAVARALLDLSPATLLAECAGASDWMWHPAVYGPAGADRFLRSAWDGSLAGPVALLVGCALAAVAAVAARSSRA